jgi:phosphate starvation-inducible PhoH-like protein
MKESYKKKKVRKPKHYSGEKDVPLYKHFKPKTANQENYVISIAENLVTLCRGPAGTGKTATAVGIACEYLSMGKVNNIVITRPVVETGSIGLGFLPGDLEDKMDPYLRPIFDELHLYLGFDEVEYYIETGVIEISPLEYMRGRNFHNTFVILDEAQNADKKQLKMLLTRIGRNSKCIVNGDITQSDLDISGYEFVWKRLKDCPQVGLIKLTTADIIRSPHLAQIISRLED